jgi:G:T/U-mismatch repair DNA glycosylase
LTRASSNRILGEMREINPFTVFNPPKAKYLILGSFVAKDCKVGWNYEWYYSNGRNQFWPILEVVYNRDLKSKHDQQKLFKDLGIALGDIVFKL